MNRKISSFLRYIQYKDRIGENWFIRDAGSSEEHHHKWYYYPRMAKNEALLFKQWDSEGRIQRQVAKDVSEKLNGVMDDLIGKTSSLKDAGQCSKSDGLSDFCIHTAFDDIVDDSLVKVPDRESIEVRCFALFD